MRHNILKKALARIRFRCVGFIDRRGTQLNTRHDSLIEKRWRAKVALNPKERERLARERLQASAPTLEPAE